MLWTLVTIVLILWLVDLSLDTGGGVLHLLLITALVVLAVNVLTGRRRTL